MVKLKASEEFTIVIRKKGRRPTWLASHQKRLADATVRAGKETQHLAGVRRLREMNRLVSQYMKASR